MYFLDIAKGMKVIAETENYMIMQDDTLSYEDALDLCEKALKEGWELISVVPAMPENGISFAYYYFKRIQKNSLSDPKR